MTDAPSGYTKQTISTELSSRIMDILTVHCAGPREAHATLVLCFIQLNSMNAEITGKEPDTLDVLADDVAKAIRSARIVPDEGPSRESH